MLQIDYDIDDFIDYCEVKRLSKKTIKEALRNMKKIATMLFEQSHDFTLTNTEPGYTSLQCCYHVPIQ